ncbi:uncharacterized protein [Lolium perenne]|uniref:uncharacterized protein n=1 Tax=Lolium perenne TaxID=4522 RepID=UPI0021F60EBF|nr:ethylene-responsive transcription factor 2-like [Lolium perenne]
MAPRRRPARSSTGFRGVQVQPAGYFAAEIRAAGQRSWLGTFNSPEEAARAYDASAWLLGRPRQDMNFPEIHTRADAEMLSPPPRIVTQAEQRRYERALLHISIAEADEHAMAEWRRLHPEDVEYEENFWAQKKATEIAAKEERRAAREDKRRRKAFSEEQHRRSKANLPTIPDEDDHWFDIFLSTEEDTDSDSDLSEWN